MLVKRCVTESQHAAHVWYDYDIKGNVQCTGQRWTPADSPVFNTRFAESIDDDYSAMVALLLNSDLSSPQGTSRLRVVAAVAESILAAGFVRPPM